MYDVLSYPVKIPSREQQEHVARRKKPMGKSNPTRGVKRTSLKHPKPLLIKYPPFSVTREHPRDQGNCIK